jgi:hypothetical protein
MNRKYLERYQKVTRDIYMKILTDFPEFNEGEKRPMAEKKILKYLSVQFPV